MRPAPRLVNGRVVPAGLPAHQVEIELGTPLRDLLAEEQHSFAGRERRAAELIDAVDEVTQVIETERGRDRETGAADPSLNVS